ncbi:hypothetical protein BDV38DRAFT_18196 [Aspergillus pseudotamarii]|uniref:Peroxisomal biogenesis factor 11 n=1 Tax=Aspergillus pseudotamarii TaxID=132259 RepID=A0A5N6T2A2_ASPPS|nr:uncharacterized protein BDV38DRAFT_18196 [Aspergillus pseudotamarii]KAE8140422.1 hypothetical protein BDV38DRAFT_18196 [Aspergillus pseudotamarii]
MSDPDHPQDGCIDRPPGTECGAGTTHSTHPDPHRVGNCRPWSRVSAGLRATDITIHKINTFISSSIGQDTALGSIEYLSHALHYLLLSRIWRKLKTRLYALLRRMQRRKPTPCHGPSTPPQIQTPAWSPLLSLSSLMFDTRCTLRLLGLFSIWAWGSETATAPPADRIVRELTRLQLVATTAYQLLENVAFLMSKHVLPEKLWQRFDSEKLYSWSLLSLCAHMMLQVGKLWRESILRTRADPKAVSSTNGRITMIDKEAGSASEAGDHDPDVLTRREEIIAARKSLVSSLTWGALCAHWGMPAGIGIPEAFIGALSFVADAWELRDTWGSMDVPSVGCLNG